MTEQLFIVLNLMKHKHESSQWLGWDFSSFFTHDWFLTWVFSSPVQVSRVSYFPGTHGFSSCSVQILSGLGVRNPAHRKAKWEIQTCYKDCSVILNPVSVFTGACIINMDGKEFAESLWERQCSGGRCDPERFRLPHASQDSVMQPSCKH